MALVAAFATTACGDDDAGPPPDTAAPSSTVSPVGGVFRVEPDVTVTASEAATIYYTTDGSTPTANSTSGASPLTLEDVADGTVLQFFAVDAAGNAGEIQSETYGMDRLGPTHVDGFAAVTTGDDVALTWDAPPAGATVVVARVDDVTATQPADGTPLAVGATIGSGAEVIFAGAGTSATDSDRPVGGAVYVAWAVYPNGVYSEGRPASARIAAPAQTAAITVNVAAQTVTIDSQPGNFTLAGSNVVFNTGTLTFDLTLTSTQEGILFNPKVVLDTLSVGTWSDAETDQGTPRTIKGGSLDGKSFRSHGPGGLAKGQGSTKTYTLTGVLADSVVTSAVAVQSDPGVLVPRWNRDTGGLMIDLGATGAQNTLPLAPTWANPQRDPDVSAYRGLVMSADGRYAYGGARNVRALTKIDLLTNTVVGGLDITGDQVHGGVADIVLDPSGRRLYAVVNDGMHNGNSRSDVLSYTNSTGVKRTAPATNAVFLIEVDTATMTETNRLVLATGDVRYRGRRPAIDRAGRKLAFVAGGSYLAESISEIFVVDLSRWTALDTDEGTAGIQGITTDVLQPSSVAFSWDSSTLVFNSSWEGDVCEFVGVVDLTAAAPVAVTHDRDDATTCDSKVMGFTSRPDGTFWLSGEMTGLSSFDPTTGDFTALGTFSTDKRAVRVTPDGHVFLLGYRDLSVMNLTTGEADATWTWNDYSYGHQIIFTPY